MLRPHKTNTKSTKGSQHMLIHFTGLLYAKNKPKDTQPKIGGIIPTGQRAIFKITP